MWALNFWRDSAERAAKTAVQSLLALLTVGVTVLEVDWQQAAAVSGTAALISLLTSVASTGIGDHGSASLVGRHRAE